MASQLSRYEFAKIMENDHICQMSIDSFDDFKNGFILLKYNAETKLFTTDMKIHVSPDLAPSGPKPGDEVVDLTK